MTSEAMCVVYPYHNPLVVQGRAALTIRVPRSILQADPKFFLRYTNIYVDQPSVTDDMSDKKVSPHECRLRDLSYSAPVYVDLRYQRGSAIMTARKVPIGRIPIMLRSDKCYLRGMVRAVNDVPIVSITQSTTRCRHFPPCTCHNADGARAGGG